MERLTFDGNFCDIAQCDVIPGGSYCESGSCTQRKVWERLKAYENTGLTPELVRETAELAIWVHDNGIEKIKEWIKADKDGRLVVLPVKPALTPAISSMLYIIEDGEIYEDSLYEGIVGMSERGEMNVIYGTIDALSFEQNDIGKTVFLTREEAEKALEAMEDETD